MAREQITTVDLVAYLSEESRQYAIQSISVFPSATYGWEANFVSHPDDTLAILPHWQKIVEKAQAKFDLIAD